MRDLVPHAYLQGGCVPGGYGGVYVIIVLSCLCRDISC